METVTKQPTDQETAAPAQVITEADKKPSVEAEPTVFTEQNVAEEQTAAAVQAQTTPEVVREEVSETSDTEEISASYTKETPVDEICALMTVEEAGNIIVPAGTCKGWTLSQVADRRPVSLKWYLTGYSGDDNILRAGARIMQSVVEEKKAS